MVSLLIVNMTRKFRNQMGSFYLFIVQHAKNLEIEWFLQHVEKI